MEFILSYNSKDITKLDLTDRFKALNLHDESPFFNRFLLLSVDNGVWQFLILQSVCVRYLISTFLIGYSKNPNIHTTCLIVFLDILYLTDLLSAILYRMKWPKSGRNLPKNATYLSRLVWRNYLYRPRKIWMVVLDAFTLFPHQMYGYSSTEIGVQTMAHLFPALRIYRLPSYYANQSKKIAPFTNSLRDLFVKTVLFWVVISHTFTCAWGWCHKLGVFDLDYSLILQTDVHSPYEMYVISFYYIQIGFTNIGFGDITPQSDAEKILTTFVMLLGYILLCGYLIAALSAILTGRVRSLTTLRFRLSLIVAEMAQNKVAESVSKKIVKFYYSLLRSRKGIGPVNHFLHTLPPSFLTLAYYDIFSSAIDACLLLKSCDDAAKRAIAREMKIYLYLAGDVILKRNQFNSRIFYIRKGTIQIMSYQDDETEVMTFGAGTVFGQIGLLLCTPCKSEVHAATFCEIHTISRKKLFRILTNYPTAKNIVINTHKNLLLNVFADKFSEKRLEEETQEDENEETRVGVDTVEENVMEQNFFYKVPIETSKLARDDICIVTKCPYVFMPNTIFIQAWDTMVAALVLIICFYYPYNAAFTRIYPSRMEPFIIIVDLVLWLDLYLTFSTAVLKENILFSSIRDIVATRLTTMLVCLDIAAIMPLHYYLIDENRMKPVLLCFRCLLFYKIHVLFSNAEKVITNTSVFVLRLVKYILYFLFGAYVIGIVYYIEACYTDPCIEDSWYERISLEVDTIWICLYFATLLMSGTGFGDITIGNYNDIFYVIVFAVFGVLLFIYLIADYSANLSLSRQPRQAFVELADRVNTFLLGQKMLRSERTRVRHFLNLQWERSQGYDFVQSSGLFHDTPKHLLYEARQFTTSRGLEKMELFQGMGSAMVGTLLSASIRMVFPPHEVVVYAGAKCESIMVIEQGFCEATYGRDVTITKILHAGQDICTVEFMLGLTALSHVRTLTHCVISKVSEGDLNRALLLNPMAAKEVLELVDEFKKSKVVQNCQNFRPAYLHLTVRTAVQKSFFHFRYYRKQSGNKELRDPYTRLGLCQWIRFLLRRTTVLPYGKFLKRWEFSRCIFAFFTAILFPCLPYFQLEFSFLYYIAILLDVTAWIDMYFRVHVCFYNKQNLLISHPLRTCSHYIKGGFVLDFIFSFPFDRIMYRAVYDINGEALVTSNSINLLRILRVGQVYRIPATLSTSGQDNLSTPSLFWVMVTVGALTTVFISLATSILVLWNVGYKVNREGDYYIVYEEKSKDHFVTVFDQFEFPTLPSYVFILNFYWTCAICFSLGFGDITANTTQLILYTVAVIVVSYLYLNYVTVVLASYLTSINMNLTIFQKRMSHLVSFLKAENVEPMLKTHIINHFEYIWKKSKGMVAQHIFMNFSVSLKDDVMFHLYQETVKGVPAFTNLEASFHRLLCSRLDEIHFQSGAAIYKPGDIITQFFIVHQGEVTLVGKDENDTMELGRSKIFGIFKNVPRDEVTLSAVATKNVTVLGISALELFQILGDVTIVDSVESVGTDFSEILKQSNQTKTDMDEELPLSSTKRRNVIAEVIHRFSKHIAVLYVILSLYSANLVSLTLAFDMGNAWCNTLLAKTFLELFFCLKVILGCLTGYVDEFGELISDLRMIRSRYVRTVGFYIDVITTLPLGQTAIWCNRADVGRWLPATKLFRLYNVWYFFNMKFDTLSVNIVVLKILSVAIWTGTFLHQCSCIWFLISCQKEPCQSEKTWSIDDEKSLHPYLTSYYFVVTVMTTTGFGDMTPHTLGEIIFVIVLVTSSFFYTAIFIGQTVSTSRKYLFAKTRYEYEVEELKNFLDVNDVSYETQKIIYRYLANLWSNERGRQMPELLISGPQYLKYEIKLSTYGSHINNNKVFKNCSENFRKQLISILTRTVFYPTDIITFDGEVNGTAYFVHYGQVKCISRKHSVNDENGSDDNNDDAGGGRIYLENTFFGLEQCLRPSTPHTGTYYAISCCVILSLNLSDSSFIPQFYPNDFKYVLEKLDELGSHLEDSDEKEEEEEEDEEEKEKGEKD